ncbi:HAD family hydrolase [Psychrobacter ciconiae]|uniref:HAD family hydrolase n=1 Tax=Psychrobacter ciconiae TaxID=1553449 RepID=UPI001D112DCB|nr:HAD-IA family hydrolase [Psychrobacter ciconiae]
MMQNANVTDKSLIIFDWDGTLMDSIGLIVESMHHAAAGFNLTTTDTAVKDIIGLSLERGIEILFPALSNSDKALLQERYSDYYIANSDQTPFFAPIEPMLKSLNSEGKTLAVATGKKRRGLDRILSVSNSSDYFAITRCTDEAKSKPHPQMLIDILEATKTPIEDTVYIGDSIFDIQMANQLEMTSIAVSYGAAKAEHLAAQNPSYQVATPDELAKLLCG